MKLKEDAVLRVSALARLTLSKKEVAKFSSELSKILDYMESLSEVDTTNTPPTSQTTGLSNITRKDEIKKERCLSAPEALSGTENIYNNYFLVKRIIPQK